MSKLRLTPDLIDLIDEAEVLLDIDAPDVMDETDLVFWACGNQAEAIALLSRALPLLAQIVAEVRQ